MCIKSHPADTAGLATMSEQRRPADNEDNAHFGEERRTADEPIESSDRGEEQHSSEDTTCENDEARRTIPDPTGDGASDDSAIDEEHEGPVAPEVGPGRLVETRRILSVRTQHESLALRACFKSQIQLGEKKSVRFDKLTVREYPIVIGDSPSTSRGVPLTLGWEYEPECHIDLDTYESTRVPGGECERRTKYELRVPSKQREEMLGNAGFSKKEMRDAVERLTADKQERRSSLRSYGRMRKIDPLLQRVVNFHAEIKKRMLLSKSASQTRLLYSDRHDPLNISIGRRGSLMSNDTLIFIDLNVDTLH